jgi:hypothetical protein
MSLALKYKLFNKEVGTETFQTLVSTAFAIPVSNYTPEAAFALDAGCPYGIGRVIAAYKTDMNIYGKAQFGYHLWGNTNIVRYYYFTDNEAYSSAEVEMPNAVDYSLTVGYVTNNLSFKAEGEIGRLIHLVGSTSVIGMVDFLPITLKKHT